MPSSVDLPTDETQIFLPWTEMPILDPEWHEGPHWRQCRISLFREGPERAEFVVRLDDAPSLTSAMFLFRNFGFRASIDRLLEDILRDAFEPELEKHFHVGPFNRFAGIMNSFGPTFEEGGETEPPTMTFQVGSEANAILLSANNHMRLVLSQSVHRVAERERQRMANFCSRNIAI